MTGKWLKLEIDSVFSWSVVQKTHQLNGLDPLFLYFLYKVPVRTQPYVTPSTETNSKRSEANKVPPSPVDELSLGHVMIAVV